MMKLRAVLLAVGLSAAAGLGASGAAPNTLEIGPYLQWMTPHEVTVVWQTSAAAVGVVRFGAGDRLRRRVADQKATTHHELRLTGLKAARTYSYQVEWAGEKSDRSEFRTAPPKGTKRFRLALYGDSRTQPDKHVAIVKRVLAEEPDLVLSTGDLVAAGRQLDQWKPMFFDPLRPLMRRLSYWPSLGNHEQNADAYYHFFALPDNEAWYSFDWGNAHLVALDSNRFLDPDSEQGRWLQQDLMASKATWKIVFFHHPMFSAHPTRGINRNRWSWEPLFIQGGVNMVLTGHDHHYQRTYPIGPAFTEGAAAVHFTSGGGGAPLYPVEKKPYTAVTESAHHFIIMDFDGETVRGFAKNLDGEVIDRFVLRSKPKASADHFIAWEPFLLERAVSAYLDELRLMPVLKGPFSLSGQYRLTDPALSGMSGTLAWTAGPNWKVTPASAPFQVTEAGGFEIPRYEAQSSWPDCYPLPRLEVRLKGAGFKNNTVTLAPIRVWPRRRVRVPATAGAVTVDGRLLPDEWNAAPVQEVFTRGDGLDRARQPTRFRLRRDGEHLYLAAEITQPKTTVLDEGETSRDGRRLASRDEMLLLRLARTDKGPVYDFAINSRGTLYDARNGIRSWNAEWRARARPSATGWTVEMAIPLSALGDPPQAGDSWRFNVIRGDRAAEDRSEWVPTWGQPRNPERLATLSW